VTDAVDYPDEPTSAPAGQVESPTLLGQRWWWSDLAFLTVLVALVFVAWSRGALTSDVGGDGFMALECGWRLLDVGFARPSQPLYGYGLCTLMAPLFVGAESLWDVALRRAVLSGMYVPLTYLLVRAALPIVFGGSRLALQVGAFSAALVVARNEALGHSTSTGIHGYFVFFCIALVLLCWLLALRWKRPIPLIVGYVLVPVAMMNQPYSIWLVPAGLALIPWFWREVGKGPVVLGLGLALAAAGPRIHWLAGRLSEGDRLSDLSGRAGQNLTEGALRLALTEVSTVPLVLGTVLLGGLLWRGSRRSDEWARCRAALGLSAVFAVGSFAAVVYILGGYLQDYHLVQLYPWGAIGWAVLIAGAFDWLRARVSRGGPLRSALVGLLVFGAVTYSSLRFASGPSELEPPRSLRYRVLSGGMYEVWRTVGVYTTRTAAGNHFYQRAILADLRDNVGSDVPLLLTNFNPAMRREDSSVALAMSLHLAGVPAHRLGCCHPGQPTPVWYWIVDTEDAQLDYSALGKIDGVDVLPDVLGTDEIVLAIRSPSALAALAAPLCDGLSEIPPMMGGYHMDWLSVLHHRGNPGLVYPESPLPACLIQSE